VEEGSSEGDRVADGGCFEEYGRGGVAFVSSLDDEDGDDDDDDDGFTVQKAYYV